MDSGSRHQCLIYDGSPSRHLHAVAEVAREKLEQNYRCLYLNSPPMVAGMRSYLAAAGVDVAREVARASLVVTSDQRHLEEGRFSVERMIERLTDTLQQALNDGYQGLWATGDMTWEFGPEKNFGKLMEYEWKLEDFMRKNPALCGICQYHRQTMPLEAMKVGLVSHPSVFANETLSVVNPLFVRAASVADMQISNPELERVLSTITAS